MTGATIEELAEAAVGDAGRGVVGTDRTVTAAVAGAGAILLVKPIEPFEIRDWTILSKPTLQVADERQLVGSFTSTRGLAMRRRK